MANVDVTKIHQGPGKVWIAVPVPPEGDRLIINAAGEPQLPTPLDSWVGDHEYGLGAQIMDSNGNVQVVTVAGTSAHVEPVWQTNYLGLTTDNTVTWKCLDRAGGSLIGATEGATTVTLAPKLDKIEADQNTAALDVVLTGEAESIEVTVKESDLGKLRAFLAHGTYSIGTDSGLPLGARDYEELHFGGILAVPKISVAAISPRRDVSGSPGKFVVSQLYHAYQSEAIQLPFARGKETTYKVKFEALALVTRAQGNQTGKIYRQT
jgi:hypothetical protein